MRISESDLSRNVFGRMKNLSCIYTVQLSPRTDKSSLEVVVFDRPEGEEDYKKMFNFFRGHKVQAEPEVVPVPFSRSPPKVYYACRRLLET